MSSKPSISGDGRYVAFASGATDLVANDTNASTPDLFVYDLWTESVFVASVSSSGEQGDNYSGSWAPSMSEDGRYVAFESMAINFVPNDANGHATSERHLDTDEALASQGSHLPKPRPVAQSWMRLFLASPVPGRMALSKIQRPLLRTRSV